MAKFKDDGKSKSREEKLASVLYAAHTPEETRKEMAAMARQDGKKPPTGPQRLSDAERSYVSPLGG
jgi:hypothetical protein